MRWTLVATVALLFSSCGRSQTSPQSAAPAASQDCSYEVIQPDRGAKAAAFRTWLKPRAEELVDGGDVNEEGDVFIADLDNDGTDETLFAKHEGSSAFLYAYVFRGAQNMFAPVTNLPFEKELELAHDYRGPLMNEPQLVARFCGKTVLSFQGGSEPNYFPVGVLWEGGASKRLCSTPWLERHHRAAGDLVNRGMLDEARVLLDGIKSGCEAEAAAEVRAIEADLARIAATTAAANAASYDFSWVMNEAKKNPGAQLVLDPRFAALLIAVIPDATLENESLRGALKKSLWLPDEASVIDGRYIVLSGCEPHNCGNRGFLWIDTSTKQSIGMTGGTLASKTTEPAKIPAAFWKHTLDAAGQWADETVDFIDRSGKATKVRVP